MCLILAKPQAETPARSQAPGRLRNQLIEIPHCARCGRIEPGLPPGFNVLFQILSQPLRTDLYRVHPTNASHLLQEGPLLRYRLQQSDSQPWKDNLQCQAWKASPAADVKQIAFQFPKLGYIEALTKMPRDAFPSAADGGQVDLGVPAQEQFQVGKDPADRLGAQPQPERRQEAPHLSLVEHQSIGSLEH